MRPQPTDGYSITLRLKLVNKPAVLGLVTSTIGNAGGSIGAIDIVEAGFDTLVRDITIAAGNDDHAQDIVEAVKALPGVTFIHFSDRVFLLHLGGKIENRDRTLGLPQPDQQCALLPRYFRGVLDCRASEINEAMKLAAANAIADCITDVELSADYIIPSVFNRRVTPAVAAVVEEAAYQSGVARKERSIVDS